MTVYAASYSRDGLPRTDTTGQTAHFLLRAMRSASLNRTNSPVLRPRMPRHYLRPPPPRLTPLAPNNSKPSSFRPIVVLTHLSLLFFFFFFFSSLRLFAASRLCLLDFSLRLASRALSTADPRATLTLLGITMSITAHRAVSGRVFANFFRFPRVGSLLRTTSLSGATPASCPSLADSPALVRLAWTLSSLLVAFGSQIAQV